MAGCIHRGGEARKHWRLLVGPPRSIRKRTHRQEHCSIAVAAKNHSGLASQGDWHPAENGPNFAKRHCYNWLSDKTNTLDRFSPRISEVTNRAHHGGEEGIFTFLVWLCKRAPQFARTLKGPGPGSRPNEDWHGTAWHSWQWPDARARWRFQRDMNGLAILH